MIENKNVDDRILEKIEESSEYNTLIETVRSKYNNVSVKNSYSYTSDKDDSDYIVALNIDSNSPDDLTLIFKIDENNNVRNASVSIDNLTKGDPDVSHILDLEDNTINIKSFENF